MKKALLVLTICLLLALLCACTTPYVVSKTPSGQQFDFAGNYTAPELTVDGNDYDYQWASSQFLARFGRDNAVSVRCYRGNAALFFFFSVKDTTLLTVGNTNDDKVTLSDSVEVYIDTLLDGGNKPQADDYQINIGAHGKARIMQGSGAAWGYWNGLIDYAITLDGALNDKRADTGYMVELMLPYDQIGIDKHSAIGITFGHVDKFDDAGTIRPTFSEWYPLNYYGDNVLPERPSDYLVLTADNTLCTKEDYTLSTVDLTGVVTHNEQPLAGAQVNHAGGKSVYTDNNGVYTLPSLPGMAQYDLAYTKEGFYTIRSTSTGTANVEMPSIEQAGTATITATLSNIYTGVIAGARVWVEGAEARSVYTSEAGVATLGGLPQGYTYKLCVAKDGYEPTYCWVQPGNASVDVPLQHASLGAFATKNNEFAYFDGSVTRTANGFQFTFITLRDFMPGALELFVNAGPTSSAGIGRTNHDYRINLHDNGKLTLLQFGTNPTATTDGLTYTLTREGTKTTATLLLPYAWLGITATDIVGISLGQWQNVLGDWDGWGYPIPDTANNLEFVDPERTDDYIRIGLDNQLYWAPTNAPID